MTNGKRTLVLRFGAIGDFVSALTFCAAHGDYDLFFCASVHDFVRGSGVHGPDYRRFLASTTDVCVHAGAIGDCLRLLRRKEHGRVLIYAQSLQGRKLALLEFALRLVCRTTSLRNISVKRYFNGGQYAHAVNQSSTFKSLISDFGGSPRISIFFDSKELANNLSRETLEAIAATMARRFKGPVITLYGAKRIEVGSDWPGTNLSGRTSLDGLAEVFANTDIAVTCDSGPMHVFAARGIPCVAFISARQELLNWLPITPSSYYIFDDGIECAGCGKAVCPRGRNVCVNSALTLAKFDALFE